jgi:hypothetical protein
VKHYKDYLIALSLANFFFVYQWPSLFLGENEVYFSATVRPLDLYSLVSSIFIFAAFFFLILWMARTAKLPFSQHAFYLLLIAVCLIPLHQVQAISQVSVQWPFFSLSHFVGNWGPGGNRVKVVILGLMGLLLYFSLPRFFISCFRNVSLIFSAAAFLTLGKAGIYALEDNYHTESARSISSHSEKPIKIVWMLFDEMDEHYSTVGRPPEVDLPNLDKFRSEAFHATAVSSPANQTILSLPSYFTGKLVSRAELSRRNDLILQYCNDPKSYRWNKSFHLVSALHARNYRSGILGWYHPYCRIMKGEYEECLSFPFTERPHASTYLASVADLLAGPFHSHGTQEIHSLRYRRVKEAAIRFVDEKNFDFIFMHWPIPHLPTVIFPEAPTFRYPKNEGAESYFNNLIEADRVLGEVRTKMEQKGTWDDTVVIVNSDHGWRSVKPEGLPWEKEKNRYSRIPFMIKFPRKKTPLKYDKIFNGVLLHDIILAIANGKIRSSQQLAQWIQHESKVSPYQPYFDTPNIPKWKCDLN